jgi:hypothetical protein
VATVRVPHGGGDVAAGSRAVWTAGVVCVGPHPDDPEDVCLTEPRVSRIDPGTGRVAATIRITLPPGTGRDTALPSAVAVGEGAVWVAVSWNPSTGEVLRIDPRTNAIAARIRTGGFVGELRLGAGSVWVLSHPEYTDETGGDLVPPVLAAGDDAVWVTSPTAAHPRLALRVDTQTNQVAREQLPVDRFYPVAVEDDAIWFIGSTGRSSTLARLDPRTLEQTAVTKLPISAVRAVHDPLHQQLLDRIAGQPLQRTPPQSGSALLLGAETSSADLARRCGLIPREETRADKRRGSRRGSSRSAVSARRGSSPGGHASGCRPGRSR